LTRRLKIAHIITRLDLGGAQQNTLYCCANHDRKLYDVLLLTGLGGYLDKEARKLTGVKTYFLTELKHPIAPSWDWKACRALRRILQDEKVDLVHTHSSKAGILGRYAARAAGVPHVVHTVHGWGFHPRQFAPTRCFYQSLERRAARFTDRIIAVSEENKRSGLSAGIGREDQYRVIHSGIEPRQYRLSPSAAAHAREQFPNPDRPRVLVLSNFKNQKSPLDVVRVGEVLKSLCPNFILLWAGDGPLREMTEREIRKRKLQDNFHLLGWREDIGVLLAATDVLLLTSLYEGLPRVVLQAMAAGKPVVATAVSGTPEAVKEGVTGFLHPPHDASGMARSLERLLKNRALAKKMGAAGRKGLKGSFLIPEMLGQIEALYQEVMEGKKK
jgi:glycosyltransferase involved in cell wall biosynthesis